MGSKANGTRLRMIALALMASCAATAPAYAMDDRDDVMGEDFDPASSPVDGSLLSESNRVFTFADFERFAPRTAFDMVTRIPGFSISGSDNRERGLGQASQNILLNGQRVSAKSNDAASTLSRIDAEDVIRIEIIDGATLDIPGLNGLVANIVYRASEMGGTFSWSPFFRDRVGHSLLVGDVTLNGRSGKTEWNASLRARRQFQGNWGPEIVLGPDGELLLRREEFARYPSNRSGFAASLTRTSDNGNVLNINAAAELNDFDGIVEGDVFDGDGAFLGSELSQFDRGGWEGELGADYQFDLGPGSLKIIGLQSYDNSPNDRSFLDVDGDLNRAESLSVSSETVLRSEYRWGEAIDWQFSLEGALNSLDSEFDLFVTPAGGSETQVPVPGANALVKEERAEAILSAGFPITDGLTLQLNAGGEYSKIIVDGDAGGGSRSYVRPKGSASIAWRASPTFTVNAEVERKVDQLSFGDFLAAVDINDDVDRGTNTGLVPSQRWRARIEATKNFPGIGAITPFIEVARIEDKVETVPISDTQEARGNVPLAETLWFGAAGTLELESIGWKGARLNFQAQYQDTWIEDPLTGDTREISSVMDYQYNANLRHDVPGTDFAWGANINRFVQTPFYRLEQIQLDYNSGHQAGIFVEHKDVAGLTVTASLNNILDSKDRFYRDVFAPRRTGDFIFREERDRGYGQIFQINIRGNI
ncbi:TonB-dependent receptor plug domain-containing protein [Sphingomicrobium sediminis]|uniref:TonB-dependent receptor plug domain-containing protein n=1 Tax=Sphingomicrobium sediminis TaxID=2950949 RepID=A0A9X2EMI9_9SPHN|nr:TonB-dependent receptor plug domain-containing protein [Sphingomicrobium sediminis]MCM8558134.1 TonB-dependent receptor plug domain-containing protein [Sphingomicrobium sediminis]